MAQMIKSKTKKKKVNAAFGTAKTKKALQQRSNFNTKDYGIAGNLAVGNTPFDRVVGSLNGKERKLTPKEQKQVNALLVKLKKGGSKKLKGIKK